MNKFNKYLTSNRLQYCNQSKRRLKIAMKVCVLITLFLYSSNSLIAQGACSNIVGTWEYQLQDRKGLFMATETHGMWLIVDKDRAPFGAAEPTESEKGQAYDGLSAAAMTHTCEGNIVTVNFLYDKSPNPTRSWFRWEYEINGDVLTYRTLNKDGSRNAEGRMRRVRD